MKLKTLLILSASAMLIAPNVSPAQPIPGPPPGIAGGGLAGPGGPPGAGPRPPGVGEPIGLARPGGPPGPRAAGLPRPTGAGGFRPGFSGGHGSAYGRSGGYAYGHARSGGFGYSRSGYGSDYGSWRHRYWPYGVYAYSSSSDSSGYYCTYKYSYRLGAYRRVRVCSEE